MCSCSAMPSSSSRASGETDEQTRIRSVPSSLHDVELAFGPAQVRGQQVGVGRVEVAERLVEVDRQAEVGAPVAQLRPATSGEATRSGSKISTPSKPAAAAAASLSSRVPEMQTVASAVRRRSDRGRPVAGGGRLCGDGHARPPVLPSGPASSGTAHRQRPGAGFPASGWTPVAVRGTMPGARAGRGVPADLEPAVAGLLSAEGWAYASALPVEDGDPGRFHALFGRDSLIFALQLLPGAPGHRRGHPAGAGRAAGPRRRPGDRRAAGQDPARVAPGRAGTGWSRRVAGARRRLHYYGTSDATSWFLVLLAATGDAALRAELAPAPSSGRRLAGAGAEQTGAGWCAAGRAGIRAGCPSRAGGTAADPGGDGHGGGIVGRRRPRARPPRWPTPTRRPRRWPRCAR